HVVDFRPPAPRFDADEYLLTTAEHIVHKATALCDRLDKDEARCNSQNNGTLCLPCTDYCRDHSQFCHVLAPLAQLGFNDLYPTPQYEAPRRLYRTTMRRLTAWFEEYKNPPRQPTEAEQLEAKLDALAQTMRLRDRILNFITNTIMERE